MPITKVVILAGGRGSRISELTGNTPKPLLLVGNKPIIQHIIDGFVRGGFKDFIIPVGYLKEQVFKYFSSTYTEVRCEEDEQKHVVWYTSPDGISIMVVDTGLDTLTGGRLLRLKEYLTEPFMMTYGDGVSHINPIYVKEMGEELNKNIITAVHPIPRFGALTISPTGEVVAFSEKSISPNDWINGGFMYLKPEVFHHMTGDSCNFEAQVLPKIVWESGLYAFEYGGYWHCIDTVRDLQQVEEDYMKRMF